MVSCCCNPRDRILANADELYRYLEGQDQLQIRRVVHAWVRTGDLVLTGETHFRAADRRRELGIEPETAEADLRRARRFNTAALEMLHTEVPTAIEELRMHLRTLEP